MKIQEHISLRDKNWFKTGGKARFFCQPVTESDYTQALEFARTHELDIVLLGQGANVLISDTGIDGLVICSNMQDITITSEISGVHDIAVSRDIAVTHNDTCKTRDVSIAHEAHAYVTAGSGVCIQKLIETCLDNNLVGLEEFSGIPGTIGGAVYINIHYFNFLLSNFLVSARVLDKQTGVILDVDRDWFNFGYDTSRLHAREHILLSGTFKLKKVSSSDTMYARGRRDEMIRYRNNRYPVSRTCGSFFRNFHEHEIDYLVNDKKMIYAAYYLDKIGVKGNLSVGGACVSHKHANMLVTNSSATSQDVINLAREMQKRVFEKFGVLLQPECQFLGFEQHPL